MAFTPDQKAAIKKRAQELLATGLSTGEAAQQAYKEISAKPEIFPTPKTQAIEKAELESREAVQQLEKTRAGYVDQRADVLEKSGVTPEVARKQAEKEFEKTYAGPVVSPYGELSERRPRAEIITAAPPTTVSVQPATLATALRPQTALPASAVAPEKVRAKEPAYAGVIGGGPDYTKIMRQLQEDGLTAQQAASQISALQSAYNINLIKAKNDAQTKKQVLPPDILQKTWDATVKEIGEIPRVLENKQGYVKDYQPTGPQDPLFLAFSKQVTAGEGVPNVSPAQGKYVATLAAAERKEAEKRIANEYKDKPLVVTSVESVEGLRGGAPRTVSRELVGEEKEAEIARRAAAEVQTPWWSDPEEVKKRLKDPTRLTKPGIFEEETAFGTQRESNLGWLVRSAMAPLNAVAGAAFPVFFTGADDETKEAVEEARRRVRPQAYKDNPVLLNIAEGRGFVGEAAELSKITGLDTDKLFGNVTIGDIYTAGAFAADLLDPSLDLVAGAARGGRAGVSAAKAAEKLGVKQAKKFGAFEGLKEAARTVVTENPALSTLNEIATLAKVPKIEPGDIRLAISNKLAEEAEGVLGVGRVRSPDTARVAQSSALKNADDNLRAFEQAVSGTGGKVGLDEEQIRKAVGDAISKNPEIPVEGIMGTRSLYNELATNDALYEATQRAIIDNSIRNGVFQATKDSVLKSGIIAVTPKVFATKDVAAKILKKYSTSPLAKLVDEVSQAANFTFKKQASSLRGGIEGAGATVKPGYKLPPGASDKLLKEAERLLAAGKFTTQDILELSPSLYEQFISADNLRRFIDAGLEDTSSGFRIVKSTDIAELNPIVSSELTKPLEVRDFSAPAFRNWFTKRGGEVPKEILTASQKGFVDEVIGAVSNLDKKLRSDVERLLTDPRFREAYSIPADKKLTREEAAGYLIAGPRYSNTPQIAQTLKLAVDKNFFQEKYVNDLFDMFTGVKLSESTDIWSKAGREELMRLANEAARRISANQGTFYPEMMKLIEDAKGLMTDPNYVKVPASEIKSPKVINGPQTLVASYYEAEANRAIRNAFGKIFTRDFEYVISPELFNAASDARLREVIAGDISSSMNKFIIDYTHRMLTDTAFSDMGALERFRAIAGRDSTATPLQISRFVSEVDGVVRKVMRNNRFDPIRNPVDDVVDVVGKMLSESTLKSQLDAIVGKEAADQLRSAVSSANVNSIQSQLSKLIAESHKDTTAMSILNRIADGIMSAFYTLVLTAAPRFHGANIIGAPSVIYSTTGRLLDPKSVVDAMYATSIADTARGATVIVTDPAGRKYTANELYSLIGERGGQSVFKADLPSLKARTALAAVAEGKVEGPTKRAVDWVLSTPDKEDALFRMAIAISALKEGRTIDDAIQLARAALYDKGLISNSEAQLQKLLLFYSFTRNNLVNLLKNLSKPEGWKRIVNTVKFKRGVESILVDPEEQKYAPESAATRILLGKTGTRDVGEKGIVVASPPDSTLSALEMLISIVSGDIAGVASGMMKPGQAMLFKESTQNEMNKVPAEHIALYQVLADTFGTSVESVLSAMTGEEIIPVRSKEPDAVDGYIYPLLSPSAKKRYQLILSGLGYIGLGRIMTDYPNIMNVSGGKAATSFENTAVGDAGRVLYNMGFIAPLKTLSAEQQRLRSLLVQNAEGRKMVKDIDEIMLKGEIAPVTGDEAGYGPRIERGQRARAEGKLGIDELKREKLRLKGEIQGIVQQIRMDPARERRGIYLNEINKRRERLKQIQELEREATK